jgi:hypothetical protein
MVNSDIIKLISFKKTRTESGISGNVKQIPN